MKLGLLGACAAILTGACGGSKPSTTPAPVPGPEPAPAPSTPMAPLRYRVQGPLSYEFERYDSLFYASMPAAPQATAKRGILTVRPAPGRGADIEVRLDSLIGLEDTRLTPVTVDSTIGSRWQLALGPSGGRGVLLGGHSTILAGQVEEFVRLLFPQLPNGGLTRSGVWSDSGTYRLQLDAFDAFETVARNSQAVPSPEMDAGITVEANERISRSGTALQAGQTMTLKGTGLRRLRYEFLVGGWLGQVTARDSLDLTVTVASSGEVVPVRWRSTLIGRLRDVPVR